MSKMTCSLHRLAVKQGVAFDRFAHGLRAGSKVWVGKGAAREIGTVQRIFQRRCSLFVRVKLDSGRTKAVQANTTRWHPTAR